MSSLFNRFSSLRRLYVELRTYGFAGSWQNLRNRLRLHRHQSKLNYSRWVETYDTISDSDRLDILRRIEELPTKPLISVVMPVFNPPEVWLTKALDSILSQLYPNWELCIADDASTQPHVRVVLEKYAAMDSRIRVKYRDQNGHISAASNSALALARGEFVALVDHDDELAEQAFYVIASEINEHPDVDILYSDEDRIEENGRRYAPQFKPDWDSELIRSCNYIAHLGVYRTSLAVSVGGFRVGFEGSQDYDFALRCVDATTEDRIRHLPFILYHWRAIEGSVAHDAGAKHYAYDAAVRSIESHLQRSSVPAIVHRTSVVGQYRVEYQHANERPSIAVIILLDDRVKNFEKCVESIFQASSGSKFVVYGVGTTNQCANTKSAQSRSHSSSIRWIAFDETQVAARRFNLAVQQIDAEVICVIDPNLTILSQGCLTQGWLTEFASIAIRPDVGVIGGKVLSHHDRILHSGFVLSQEAIGNHVGVREAGAYFATQVARELTAVSGAFMAIRREVLIAAGLYDAEVFGDFYFNIDLCLRLRQRGYRCLWTPFAQACTFCPDVIEHTPDSNSSPQMVAEYQSLLSKWRGAFGDEQRLSPNLRLGAHGFDLAFPPQIEKPWRK